MGKYDQIIHMKRPVDKKHAPMSLQNRAAQFAPFDALTGFSGRIRETSRLVDRRIELTDDAKQEISATLCRLESRIKEHPEITVTYYVPDNTKDGGSYRTITALAAKINTYKKILLLEEDLRISFEDILEIRIESEP